MLLLQHGTTNALESYHRLLKQSLQGCRKMGIINAITAVIEVNSKRFKKVKDSMSNRRSNKKFKSLKKFPALLDLNYDMQRLVSEQLRNAYTLLSENGLNNYIPEGLTCSCDFSSKYMLPCQHIFFQHLTGEFNLSNRILTESLIGIEESGFDIYQKKEKDIS